MIGGFHSAIWGLVGIALIFADFMQVSHPVNLSWWLANIGLSNQVAFIIVIVFYWGLARVMLFLTERAIGYLSMKVFGSNGEA
ncbi:hypothetical protein EBB79_01255 [Parasedimentitalea marina]|uniref:Uncharacterized protein n=1 Tax=Parasedimentitalea marina TaxID=2483033 RepID=A0A3T0MY09_9RHOB|nr:hypothetical protein [Parasedimentitalea marina]AZV76656.1 hypothetical protein EBB79_01255 [Parasedimentitalea marina]